MSRARLVLGFGTLLLVLTLIGASSCWGGGKEDEERLGREYAQEIERDLEMSKDPAVLDRVKRVGQTLAQIANEHEVRARYGSSEILKFKYQFKVVEDKDVNAFSLPSGIIYVNTGLLDLATSDDELAGVLAHEIAHAAHHHMASLVRKASKFDKYVALVTLAAVLGRLRNQDMNNLLMGAQMIRTGKISSYTQEAERDADRTAVAYLARSPYKPEGLLTFMKKLEAKQDQNPGLPLGIFETHPAPFRRAASIAKAMREEGFNADLRRIFDIAYAKAVPVAEGSDQYQVVISKRAVCRPACLDGGDTSKSRAETIAGRINSLLNSGVKFGDICEDGSCGRLTARGTEILKVETADTALARGTTTALLDKARSALAYAVWADWLCSNCPVTRQQASGD